jgi:peptidoglycan hydrolase-like protein with peptidoglycan-binding domain
MRRVVGLGVCLLAASVIGGTRASAAQPRLVLGSRGGLVASWQQAMNLWLSSSGVAADKRLRARLGGGLAVDGVFGANTLAATKRFQREAQLRSTGTVGLPDWKAWIGANVTQPNGAEGISSGNSGGPVGWWQISLNRWLRRHHRPPVVVDCIFGRQTRAATLAFQRSLRLRATGVVDPRTWATAERLGLTHFP